MQDNVRLNGVTTLIVRGLRGTVYEIPCGNTDDAELVLKRMLKGDSELPTLKAIAGCGISYSVKTVEYFMLGAEGDDDDLPF